MSEILKSSLLEEFVKKAARSKPVMGVLAATTLLTSFGGANAQPNGPDSNGVRVTYAASALIPTNTQANAELHNFCDAKDPEYWNEYWRTGPDKDKEDLKKSVDAIFKDRSDVPTWNGKTPLDLSNILNQINPDANAQLERHAISAASNMAAGNMRLVTIYWDPDPNSPENGKRYDDLVKDVAAPEFKNGVNTDRDLVLTGVLKHIIDDPCQLRSEPPTSLPSSPGTPPTELPTNINIAWVSTGLFRDVWTSEGLRKIPLNSDFEEQKGPLSWSSKNKIIVASHSHFNWEIESRTPYLENGERFMITNNPAVDQEPSVSENGEKVAFSSNREDNIFKIFVADTNGTESNVRPLNNIPYPQSNPKMFNDTQTGPDGTLINRELIVFEVQYPEGKKLVIQQLNNPFYKIISTGQGNDGQAAPAPDHSGRIVYKKGNDSLIIYSTDLQGERSTKTLPYRGDNPSWVPDPNSLNGISNEILYDRGGDIYLLNLTTGQEVRQTYNPAQDFKPVSNSDGKIMAWTSNRVTGKAEVNVMPIRRTPNPNNDAAVTIITKGIPGGNIDPTFPPFAVTTPPNESDSSSND